jgi:hypothetical protein
LALSGIQIDLNAEALAMTRLKFEVPHGIFWPAIELFAGLFAHLRTTAAPFRRDSPPFIGGSYR